MAELNPLLDLQVNGGSGGGDGAGTGEMVMGSTGKRQRRPSVRLGDIGGDPPLEAYENLQQHSRRGSSKLQLQYPWKQLQKGSSRLKNNETLVDKDGIKSSEDGIEGEEDNEGDLDLDRVAIGSWKTFRDGSKSKRGRGGSIRKRVRSNWVSSKIDESEKLVTSGGEGEGDGDEGFHLDNDEGMDRDFGRENLEEEMEEVERNESPIRSFDNNTDNEDVDVGRKRGGFLKLGEKNSWRRMTTMVSDEMEGPSDSVERNGVKIWLNRLGLGRYGPVFEIHEVDDEVLPMLTLEDLKDMGINAVGTRRKMYCSIQKLNKGFS